MVIALTVTRPDDSKQNKSLHGLTRTLINNMVMGVKDGFTKTLELQGVGYRVAKVGEYLIFQVGYSHPVQVNPPDGHLIHRRGCEPKLSVSGIDKHLVGQVAANIRSIRKPEPYKGKGIRYTGERRSHEGRESRESRRQEVAARSCADLPRRVSIAHS